MALKMFRVQFLLKESTVVTAEEVCNSEIAGSQGTKYLLT